MKIKFEITTIPEKEQKKYLTAYLEGCLQIFIGGKLFFNQSGILLIEFAIVIRRWLTFLEKNKVIDFVYETMDYDEPILRIIHTNDNNFRIESVWQEMEVKELLRGADVVIEFKKYIENLSDALRLQLGVKLSDIIS
jgi:hypothetical protein